MDDVVLHYQPGSDARLSFLLETTEKVLEPFPCRTPPVFTPWFSSSGDHLLPIRPARPPPVISSSAVILTLDDDKPHCHTVAERETSKLQEGQDGVSENRQDCPVNSAAEQTQQSKDVMCIPETPNNLLPFSPFNKPGSETRLSPEKQPQKDGFISTHCPIKRSWSVFSQRGVLLHSSQSLSKQFSHMVSIHSLHLRQRVKWVISEDNCGVATSIEQVWRTLSRSVQRAKLPTCNANIQREQAEIWVFCDVLYAEQVGRFLKDQLQLSGRIILSVHKLGNVFSL